MSRKPWVFLSVAAVAIVSAGVAFVSGFDSEEEALPFSPCPESRSDTEAVRPSELGEAAAGYRGPGPHRLHVVGMTDNSAAGLGHTPDSGLPESWAPLHNEDGPYQWDTLELVACEYQYAVGEQGELNTCPFRDPSSGVLYYSRILSAKYEYRVYEAATAELVTSFTVDAVAGECARSRTLYPGDERNTEHPGTPDVAEVERQLEPLVERDLP